MEPKKMREPANEDTEVGVCAAGSANVNDPDYGGGTGDQRESKKPGNCRQGAGARDQSSTVPRKGARGCVDSTSRGAQSTV